MYTRSSVCTHVHIHTCICGGQRSTWGVFLLSNFLRKGLTLNYWMWSSYLANELQEPACLCPLEIHDNFYVGSPSSGSYICQPGTLWIEPFPQASISWNFCLYFEMHVRVYWVLMRRCILYCVIKKQGLRAGKIDWLLSLIPGVCFDIPFERWLPTLTAVLFYSCTSWEAVSLHRNLMRSRISTHWL